MRFESMETYRGTLGARIAGAIRRGMKASAAHNRQVVAVWCGRTPATVKNWTREHPEVATAVDAVSFLALCQRSEGPMRSELRKLVQSVMPELEHVEPVGSDEAGSQ